MRVRIGIQTLAPAHNHYQHTTITTTTHEFTGTLSLTAMFGINVSTIADHAYKWVEIAQLIEREGGLMDNG